VIIRGSSSPRQDWSYHIKFLYNNRF